MSSRNRIAPSQTLLGSLPAKVELSRLFQVDMIKPARESILGEAVLDEIIRGVDILHGLAHRPRQNALAQFREAFVARYEHREVPLVEALDEEVGLGFGASGETSPLLKDVAFPTAPEEIGTDPVRQTLLLRRLSEALRSGTRRSVLNRENWKQSPLKTGCRCLIRLQLRQ